MYHRTPPKPRPESTYPNTGGLIDYLYPEKADIKDARIRALEKEVEELRRYKEEQEEKDNPKVRKYRKKPVVIEAIRFTTVEALKKAFPDISIYEKTKVEKIYVQTLEGKMEISEGDYIIKGIKGEYYPCKPDVFKESYERYNF